MIKVAITGNIASGKSTVEEYIKQTYPVIDTDKIAHNLLEKKQDLIKKTFSNFDILENDKISRKKLAEIVFSDNTQKQKLENILHPEIKKEIIKFFEQNSSSNFAFVSVPLLFEAHFENLFDKIIFIYANDNLRLERLIKRNNLSKDEAIKRINAQISQEEKIAKCDFVIKNEKNKSYIQLQIKNLLKKI